ncbi:MAG TPA: FAD/NAD(P)-binding oxidoreductase [Actinomycetota bacterium]|nr:FAD/NAD(P)-binding oxidoreductase [Actinomycetota bacterium]
MAKRVLVLGGGFGGVAAAVRLRQIAPGDEVVLADRGTHFKMGFRKTMEITGHGTMAEGSRPLEALERHGIRFVRGEIASIDPAARAAVVDGRTVEADALLVALGAQGKPDAVPGFLDHGLDIYGSGVAEAAETMATIESGRVVIGILGNPYPCSPAPFELALLLDEATRARGANVTLSVFSPMPSSLPVVGPSGCEAIEGRLAGRFIDFLPNTKAERVEAGRVIAEGGATIPFDVLLGIPGHVVPPVLADAGLTGPGGWVKAGPATLETGFEGVWAAGDCVGMQLADGKPMPKAGVIAEGEALAAAERIAAFLRGDPSEARWNGEGGCYLETGDGEAMQVQGSFLADPPDVKLLPPSRDNLEAKQRYERERLAAWFGQ